MIRIICSKGGYKVISIQDLRRDFINTFGEGDEVRVFFAPGRVNLIGEHTDYNGGYVFPCALNFGTFGAARRRNDDKIRMYSKNAGELSIVEFPLNDLKFEEKHGWANYPKGVLKVLMDEGFDIGRGFEVLFFGNIPGGGLSSSASLELTTAVALRGLFNLDIDMLTMVRISQKAENEFIGVSCGIMDQFAIGMSKEDKAMLLDCNSMEYKYTALDLKDASIVIANSNKSRELADSKYNERRNECERALNQLNEKLDINFLGELNEAEFEENKHLIMNEVDRRRAKHAVYENQRTKRAVEILEAGDLEGFGKLMNESHISLRDDYEVTGKELDTLVELAWQHEGTIGARMTGAGFGGCIVSIVRNEMLEQFIKDVGEKYKEKIGYKADFYIASVGDGARELKH